MSHLQSKRDEQGRAAAAWEGALLAEDRRAEHPPPPAPHRGREDTRHRTREERRGGQGPQAVPT